MTNPSRTNARDVREELGGGDCLGVEAVGMKSRILSHTGGGNGCAVGWWESVHHKVTVTCV